VIPAEDVVVAGLVDGSIYSIDSAGWMAVVGCPEPEARRRAYVRSPEGEVTMLPLDTETWRVDVARMNDRLTVAGTLLGPDQAIVPVRRTHAGGGWTLQFLPDSCGPAAVCTCSARPAACPEASRK
jgi:hypothetical protein